MASSNYFTGGGNASEKQATWVDWTTLPTLEVVPGLRLQPFTSDNVMVSVVHLDPHTEAAVHHHDEEQIAFVIDGEIEFEVGGEARTLRRGDAVMIPSNVPHGARTKEGPCLQIDIFNPPRKALQEALGLD